MEIPLANGGVALIDDADYPIIAPYKWRWIHPKRNLKPIAVCANPGSMIYMHRLIMGAKKGEIIDHENRTPLDNRRANLRFANNVLNGANRDKRAGAMVPYKGVTRRKESGKYRARIRVNKQLIHLGDFAAPEDAGAAYDVAARKYFGAFACLNFAEAA